MTFFYLNERFKRLFESYAHESVQRKRYVTSKLQIFVRKCSETVGQWDAKKKCAESIRAFLWSIGEGFQ